MREWLVGLALDSGASILGWSLHLVNKQQLDMTDSKPNPEGGEPKGPSIEDLQKQIENLNKGIATYRDDAKKALERAERAEATAKAVADASKAKTDNDGEDLVPLTAEDQKRLEAWAKSQGFATKEEILEERQRIQADNLRTIETQAIDEFLAQHSEYNDEEKWEELKKEFGQYKQPANLAEYRRILNKVHKELNPKKDDDGAARARAEIETRKRLGLGGGSQHSDDQEMTAEKLAERYPRLSKDQIEARLKEIKSIYPDKK
jgi:hypothetical protein